MNQTMASVLPSVVVTAGDVAEASVAHQATAGWMAPAFTATEIPMIARPPAPAGQRAPPALRTT